MDDPFRPQPAPFEPSPYTGYQAPKPMGFEAPKYAQFETGKNGLAVDPPKSIVSEDALPPMPSWEGASSKRILTEDQKEQGMEMGNLTPDGQKMPLMSGGVGGARSPATSPINDTGGNYFGGRGAPNGYMQGTPTGNLPYGPGGISRQGSPAMMNGRGGMGGPGMNSPGMNGPGMNGPRMNGPGMNGPGMNSPGMNGPGMNGPGMNGPGMGAGFGGPGRGMPMGGGPPRGQFNQPPGPQGYNAQRPGFPPAAGYRGPPQRQYSNDAGGRNGPPPQRQYSNDSGAPYPPNGPQRQFSGNNGFPPPGPQRQYSNDSGAPYGQNGPQRSLTGNGGFQPPPPQRQYSNDSFRPSEDMHRPPVTPSSPINNTGGFDFNLGGASNQPRFEPPDHSDYAPSTTAPPSYASRAPPQQRQFSPPPQELHHNPERSYSPPQEIHEMPTPISTASRPGGTSAYPGYKPYSPAPMEGARSTPPPPSALMPGRPNY